MKFFLILLLSFYLHQANTDSAKKTLTVGGFYASGLKTTFQNASGVINAVELALREINRRPNVLAEYELKVDWEDTKVSFKN